MSIVQEVSYVDTNDIDIARESLIKATLPQRFTVDTCAGFHLRHRRLALRGISINDVYYGQQSHVSVGKIKDFFCILIPQSGKLQLRQGLDRHSVEPGLLYITDPMRDFETVISGHFQGLNVRLNRDSADQFLRSSLVNAARVPLSFTKTPVPIQNDVAALVEFLLLICRNGAGSESNCNGLIARQMEQSVMAMLLTSVPNNYRELLTLIEPERPQVVDDAEQFIFENLTNPISLHDITKAVGVSERTLYYAFARYRRLTPLRFLKLERLKLARRMLQSPDGVRPCVSEVALACGFNHLSKFAKDYASHFGELPRITLQKARCSRRKFHERAATER